MPERKRWTKDDVQLLIETLQGERPDLWEAYVQGEIRDNAIADDISRWISVTIKKVFLVSSLSEMTDLLFVFRNITRRELGLSN